MTTKISGTEGVDLIKDGTVKQADLAANVVGNGPVFTGRQAGPTGGAFALTTLTDIIADTNEGNAWNPTTDRFLPLVAGWYQFNMRVTGVTSVAMTFAGATIRKNSGGAGNQLQNYVAPYSALYAQPSVSGIFYMNGTTDYVQFLVDAAGGAGTLNWSDAIVSAALVRSAP